MAYNRNIRSRAQSDFLDEWLKHLRAEKDGEYVRMFEEYKLAYPEEAKDPKALYRNVCKAMDHYYRYGDIPVAIYETHTLLSEESA